MIRILHIERGVDTQRVVIEESWPTHIYINGHRFAKLTSPDDAEAMMLDVIVALGYTVVDRIVYERKESE